MAERTIDQRLDAHTPGPWSRNIPPASKYCVVFAGRNTHVATVCTQGLSESEIEGNINLIAAAPETAQRFANYVANARAIVAMQPDTSKFWSIKQIDAALRLLKDLAKEQNG
jgi:hypothetical protein